MRNRKTQGFTLIELLIVIAIIGILAAVLIPNLLSARTRAFDTAAQSCAKGIATAAEIHQIDEANYDFDAAFVQANGGNACTADITVTGWPTGTNNTTYSVTVQHTQSSQTFTVTPSGITKN